MRILQIIQRPQLRGAETFACQLSQHLIQLGNQVDVLFLFGEEQLKMPFDLSFIYLKANEKIRWLDIASFRKLAKIINAGNYDIVQANAGDTLKYASLSRKIFKWKSKLVYRNANKLSDFLTSPIKKLVNQWLVNEIDFVASVSNECRLDFEKTFNFSSDRLLTLPIGVNDSISKSYSSLADIKIYGTGPFFLSVASFVSEKNHKGLIQIFSSLLKKCPTSKLLLVGEGKLKSDIKKVVSELDLSESVYFLGNRNDVLGIMPLSKALLLPSLIEGLPAVIIEAFISRLPVIAYDVGGIKEVVRNNQSGYLIPKGNETMFLQAIEHCISSDNNVMVENAHQLALSEYSNKKIASRFLEYYQFILTN